MIYDAFFQVYMNFKMHFYSEVFKKWSNREVSLTTVETFCMEAIMALDKPTVTEFAEYMSLSSANAADKVNNLIRKGYLKKIQSKEDKRRYYLEVTQKYLDYYNISYSYLDVVMKRLEERFPKEKLDVMEEMLRVMDEELMNEVQYRRKKGIERK